MFSTHKKYGNNGAKYALPKTLHISYIAKNHAFWQSKSNEDSLRLGISNDDVVIEIGSGNGQALLEIEKKKPSKIYAAEISEDFVRFLFSIQ